MTGWRADVGQAYLALAFRSDSLLTIIANNFRRRRSRSRCEQLVRSTTGKAGALVAGLFVMMLTIVSGARSDLVIDRPWSRRNRNWRCVVRTAYLNGLFLLAQAATRWMRSPDRIQNETRRRKMARPITSGMAA